MKLSKAQQEVVDKMREGAVIYQNTFSGRIWLRKEGINTSMNASTYMALHRLGIIQSIGYADSYNECFGLTEKYRNNER